MASPAPAAVQVNGVAALSRPDSPASINSSTKRKRDASDDGGPDTDLNSRDGPKPAINGVHKFRDEKPLIRDFFDVLQSLDPAAPSLFKRPLPDSFSDAEPSAKRAKSAEDGKPTSIADKVKHDAYDDVEGLFRDFDQITKAHIKDLESASPNADRDADDDAATKVKAFRSKAFELWRRELAYPNVPQLSAKGNASFSSGPSAGYVLTTVGAAPTLKPLFTSLRHPNPNGVSKPPADEAVPSGVTLTQILPDATSSSEKASRTLGELFPSPRNLPPLQPPKAPKPTTKGNTLTFYHPELTEKSKYRTGTYFSQVMSAGHWLDYSNATPTTHAKSKQRERAQSLAGHKPSSVELEMSEMEALFRGAFSSFAPSKDDSAAIIPSRQVGRVWWTRVGQKYFNKLVDSEAPEDDTEDSVAPELMEIADFDEDRVKEVIDNWDDSLVDPSLDEVLGKKSDIDKDTDDLLEEVSDLIETLLSFQRNRNLALPTSQDRYSADPNNGDMLRNGNSSHQPSEDEVQTYQALKAQLSLIISQLPPFAVTRLNSDKLEELSVSTKIEVRTDEYKGVMEEDEPARLARQAAQAAANSSQRQQHRVSAASPSPYANQQYPGHFVPNARPIANTQHFPQTPSRPQVPNVYQQRAPATAPVPIPQPGHYGHQRPPPGPQYRPQAAHGYAPQLAKAQTPYGHSNMTPYAASPTQQQRIPQHPNYNMAPAPSPNHRYPQGYQPGYQQPQAHPQHMQHPQHPPQHAQHSPMPQHMQTVQLQGQMMQHSPQHAPMSVQHVPQHAPQHPQQSGFTPYANGGQPMPRTMSPQVPPAHGYGQSPTPPQQHHQIPRPPYGSPGVPPNAMSRQFGPASQAGMIQHGSTRNAGLTGYATVMPEGQQRQVMEQARARADAEQRAIGHMGKVAQGEVVPTGLAGIGLGGTFDVNKVAAAKMQMGTNNMSPSPRPSMQNGPSPVNGSGLPVPSPSPSMAHAQHGAPSPAPHQQHAPSPVLPPGQRPPNPGMGQVPMQGINAPAQA
ncbi:hypothetical protein B0T16DRAFT_456836 [Cercophora newfieldiana]|uniref:Uncharacterized protein n=1 Tax=Cercophora newfieldiana TaxID=92897 RepID=A0AA40CSV0_9PEZI|nr:hypothetical protein B0T16DRAFT_456836 [Cercophora newfieldiana]